MLCGGERGAGPAALEAEAGEGEEEEGASHTLCLRHNSHRSHQCHPLIQPQNGLS